MQRSEVETVVAYSDDCLAVMSFRVYAKTLLP